MEFFQFHPTALRLPGVSPFLISEAVRGEGAVLRNGDGHRFMPDYSPDADLAPRDVVARSILFEMRKTSSDRVFLDVTHVPPTRTATRFPHIYRFCLDHGLDITRTYIPVAPAAHYLMGGVKVNTWGETNIPGLFAAGETACTGVHGANRLASNSLLEVLVFSKRSIERSQVEVSGDDERLETMVQCYTLPSREPPRDCPALNLAGLQALLWDKVGIVRDVEGLYDAARILAAWQSALPAPADRLSFELNAMVINGRMMTEAALLRQESRGAHYRSDYPVSTVTWKRHIVIQI
jgi:L-aspartate oxidase